MPKTGSSKNNNGAHNWSPEELLFIKQNLHMSNKMLCGELEKMGYQRTIGAIRRIKSIHSMKKEY